MAVVEQVRTKDINYDVEEVHVSQIKWGDTVIWDGKLVTVGKKDVSYCSFMGHSLFGDNHRCGTVPVKRANILRAM